MDFKKKIYLRGLVSLSHVCNSKSIKTMKLKSTEAKQPIIRKSKYTSEILEHYSKSAFLRNNLEHINCRFLDRKVYTPCKMIMVDELVAKNVVEAIKSDIIKTPEPVFEANPGFGLITKELLKIDQSHLPKICLFENDPYFKTKILEICEQHSRRLKIYSTNILELWKLTFLDKIDKGGRFKGVMEVVSIKEWDEEPCVKIIGVLSTSNFIRTVITSIVFRHGLTTYGRPELYILISPSLYSRICKPSRPTETLFNMFFKWHCLMEVDQKSFLPWTLEKPRLTKQLIRYGYDPSKYYLLKAVPKQDLYKIVTPELMKPLWYFCKNVNRGSRQRVLPSLEKWIPDCGPRLISKGVDTFTEFGDLTPDEILQVFLEFVNWPEFSSCPFLASMEHYLMKSDTEEEITDSTEDDGTSVQNEQILKEVKVG